ncbi:MAG TPA: metallophosphoesterase [Acidobacteriota bacterium]|nr:metallophosphoesterase [Acidobacteriota bacterium]
MKIGIISDTHDNEANIQKVVKILKKEKCGMVLHAGDFVAPLTLEWYKGLPLIGVFGNNDGDIFRMMRKAKENEVTMAGAVWEEVVDGHKMIMYHGTEPAIVDALIQCQKYDIVVYGHTHVVDIRTVGKTLVINPGTVHGFGEKATYVLLETTTKKAKLCKL